MELDQYAQIFRINFQLGLERNCFTVITQGSETCKLSSIEECVLASLFTEIWLSYINTLNIEFVNQLQ